ncbi:hypothetical protein CPLU01_15619 [Colletotrichum plurivorum]|uniref:Uncharacterized protein n=1 Tax=Colletotrichum plurivorum TaxID=2175906 RepID=A0A8H6MUM6_9PEZI|nr:hypothetical protein CPLU01_15619 [Colletotrichum plurivorum]
MITAVDKELLKPERYPGDHQRLRNFTALERDYFEKLKFLETMYETSTRTLQVIETDFFPRPTAAVGGSMTPEPSWCDKELVKPELLPGDHQRIRNFTAVERDYFEKLKDFSARWHDRYKDEGEVIATPEAIWLEEALEKPEKYPGDHALIRGFDPAERAHFDTFKSFEKMEGSMDDKLEALERDFFPDDEEGMDAFLKFCDSWLGRYKKLGRVIETPRKLFDEILLTNFAIHSSRVLLALDDGDGLRPLHSHRRGHLWRLHNFLRGELVHRSILGLNTSVDIAPDGSVKVDETPTPTAPPRDQGGFVFAQVCSLYSWDGKDRSGWKKGDPVSKLAEGSWSPTNFGVVAKLDKFGAASSVHVIYNVWEERESPDPDDPDYYDFLDNPFQRDRTHDDQGRPSWRFCKLREECEGTFFSAKIADNIGLLSEPREFSFEVEARTECQIVSVREIKEAGKSTVLVREYIGVKEPEESDLDDSDSEDEEDLGEEDIRALSLSS